MQRGPACLISAMIGVIMAFSAGPVALGAPFVQTAEIAPSVPSAGAYFGASVAVDRNVAVIGAPDDGPGSAYIFVNEGGRWRQLQKLAGYTTASFGFGISVAIDGDTIVVGSDAIDDAAAWVFVRSGAGWTLQKKLTPHDAEIGQGFGNAVAIRGDTVVVCR